MYQFSSRGRYSEVDSERNLTIPALLDYLQDCCTFQSEQLGVGVDYLMKQQAAWVLSSWRSAYTDDRAWESRSLLVHGHMISRDFMDTGILPSQEKMERCLQMPIRSGYIWI